MGGKKKGQSGLGKSVIRDRFQSKPHKADSFLHSSELQDGFDWGRLNLQSVTEQSNLDDFLATAELAGTEFTAEKLNVRFINPALDTNATPEQRKQQSVAQDANRQLLKIPRRPRWDAMTTPEELDRAEKDSFLDWRRQLAELGEKEHIVLTPFEKNLGFWRQLWRVIERSDIVVQIVDARHPLLYRCEDLESYVKEMSAEKSNVILVNKADYLTEKQRKYWYEYFASKGIQAVFWSAVLETERLKELERENTESEEDSCEASDEDSDNSDQDSDSYYQKQPHSDSEGSTPVDSTRSSPKPTSEDIGAKTSEIGDGDLKSVEDSTPSTAKEDTEGSVREDTEQSLPGSSTEPDCTVGITDRLGQASLDANESESDPSEERQWRLLNGEELTEVWKAIHKGVKVTKGVTTVGLVGYPNVGKSSTINALLKTKKVPVSATPGRTKHFQTLFLESDLLLCDCPGLVMPSFVSTKADMVISGILPIDQMRDYLPPVQLVCQFMDRAILEATYGLNIPLPLEGDDANRPPTAHELLTSYGFMRGFMTHKGIPDLPRSSRIILKDFVNGKLLYRHPPPGVSVENYGSTFFPEVKRPKTRHEAEELSGKVKAPTSTIDRAFFETDHQKIHAKGVQPPPSVASGSGTSQDGLNAKPWKRHHNKGKKEKTRRTFAHLDKH